MSKILTLEDLLSKEIIIEQTKYNIEILEGLEEALEYVNDDVAEEEQIKDIINNCIQSNMELWLYISRLAEAQGIDLPEYQG